jgi:hypothetical protein
LLIFAEPGCCHKRDRRDKFVRLFGVARICALAGCDTNPDRGCVVLDQPQHAQNV